MFCLVGQNWRNNNIFSLNRIVLNRSKVGNDRIRLNGKRSTEVVPLSIGQKIGYPLLALFLDTYIHSRLKTKYFSKFLSGLHLVSEGQDYSDRQQPPLEDLALNLESLHPQLPQQRVQRVSARALNSASRQKVVRDSSSGLLRMNPVLRWAGPRTQRSKAESPNLKIRTKNIRRSF